MVFPAAPVDKGLNKMVPYVSLPNDNFVKFVMNTTKQHKELLPIWACIGVWSVFFVGIVGWSFSKPEIWINRSNKTPPWEWSRVKHQYEKRQKFLIPATPIIAEVAELQEAMIKARDERMRLGH